MQPIYLGIDVAGATNTWIAALALSGDVLQVVKKPCTISLKEIVEYCESQNVVAVAIDAQLTVSLFDETGFRPSDKCLRALLPPDCRNWVASVNSLMAVPVRGRLLGDYLAPIVGTILETHPRVSLYFGLEKNAALQTAIHDYKKGTNTSNSIEFLWRAWAKRFEIEFKETLENDGALDLIVCATVAYLYHQAPDQLLRLPHQGSDKTGRGPFYVLANPGN